MMHPSSVIIREDSSDSRKRKADSLKKIKLVFEEKSVAL